MGRLGGPFKHEKDEPSGMIAPSPFVARKELLALDQVIGSGKT
jgi:hypothetical protein